MHNDDDKTLYEKYEEMDELIENASEPDMYRVAMFSLSLIFSMFAGIFVSLLVFRGTYSPIVGAVACITGMAALICHYLGWRAKFED